MNYRFILSSIQYKIYQEMFLVDKELLLSKKTQKTSISLENAFVNC